jgi:hypothetical protein
MTTFTLNLFNNNFENKKEHVKIKSRQLQNNNIGRTNDCQKPFRNPYNHWRKTTTCGNDCITNEKVIKDNTSINFNKSTCYNPYIRNILNKDGLYSNSFAFSKSSLNYKNGITFEQNTRSAIRTKTDISNVYVTTPSQTNQTQNILKVPCNKNVVKFRNRYFNTNAAVSGRNRIARLKYNTVLQASAGNAENYSLISRQGASHHIRPPYRNNKYYDNNGKKSIRPCKRHGILGISRIRCNSNVRHKTNGDKKKEFDFAKVGSQNPTYTYNFAINYNTASTTPTTNNNNYSGY